MRSKCEECAISGGCLKWCVWGCPKWCGYPHSSANLSIPVLSIFLILAAALARSSLRWGHMRSSCARSQWGHETPVEPLILYHFIHVYSLPKMHWHPAASIDIHWHLLTSTDSIKWTNFPCTTAWLANCWRLLLVVAEPQRILASRQPKKCRGQSQLKELSWSLGAMLW